MAIKINASARLLTIARSSLGYSEEDSARASKLVSSAMSDHKLGFRSVKFVSSNRGMGLRLKFELDRGPVSVFLYRNAHVSNLSFAFEEFDGLMPASTPSFGSRDIHRGIEDMGTVVEHIDVNALLKPLAKAIPGADEYVADLHNLRDWITAFGKGLAKLNDL